MLNRSIIFGCLLPIASASSAFAQSGPPQNAFVPWTVDAARDQNLRAFLADKPYALARPIVDWLDQNEQAAQSQASAAAQAKKKTPEAPAETGTTPAGH